MAPREAGAEVEPEHERGLRHGFEVDRAVARALRRRTRLADEPGDEKRLQRQRDGRLRDSGTPGDLRPRDGRAEAYRLEDGALVEPPEERRNGAIGHLVSDSNAQPPRCSVDSREKAEKSLFVKFSNSISREDVTRDAWRSQDWCSWCFRRA